MNLRKFLLTACSVFLIAMFGSGLWLLTNPQSILAQHGREQSLPGRPGAGGSGTGAGAPVNLLLLGLDYEELRTDTILLLNYNPISKKLAVLSVERDTKVETEDGSCKINALYAKGGERYLAGTIEEMTGLAVHYYLTLNFKGFRDIIDLLDGVEFDVPFDMDYEDPTQDLYIHLRKGRQLLDGSKAEQLVRYRKGNHEGEGYTEGDVGRIRTQQEFIRAVISQKLALQYLPKVYKLSEILSGSCSTNLTINDLHYYLPLAEGLSGSSVKTFSLQGESNNEKSGWYFYCDVEKTRNLVNNNFSR